MYGTCTVRHIYVNDYAYSADKANDIVLILITTFLSVPPFFPIFLPSLPLFLLPLFHLILCRECADNINSYCSDNNLVCVAVPPVCSVWPTDVSIRWK